jgi:branched-subunit amino acid transport protein
MGMARDRNFGGDFGLGVGTVEISRIVIILIMGLRAFAVRAGPQIFFVGQKFPEAWDRLLRYLSYAFICSIIAVTLFLTGAKFDSQLAPYRAAALLVTIIIAHRTKSAVTGMLVGTALVLLFSWIR